MKLVADLKIGDYVQSRNTENKIVWSKVWFINEHNGISPMLRLHFVYNDGNDFGNLTLTPDHLLIRMIMNWCVQNLLKQVIL